MDKIKDFQQSINWTVTNEFKSFTFEIEQMHTSLAINKAAINGVRQKQTA